MHPARMTPEKKSAADFWLRGSLVIGIYLLQGIFAEDVVLAMNAEGENLSWFVSLLTVGSQFLMAYISILRDVDRPWSTQRGGGLRFWSKNFRWEYGVSGLSVVLYAVLSNSATFSLNFNTVQLFKTSKIVFVMVTSWALMKKTYSPWASCYGALLAWGLYLLSVADVASKREVADANDSGKMSQAQGFLFMFLSMAFVALNNVLQEAVLRQHTWSTSCSLCCAWLFVSKSKGYQGPVLKGHDPERRRRKLKNELIFFTTSVTGFILLVGSVYYGELTAGVAFFLRSPVRLLLEQCVILGINTWGQRLMLDMSHLYGSASATIIATLRKTITFALSVLFFPKPFSKVHAFALILIAVSACLLQLSLMKDDAKASKAQSKSDQVAEDQVFLLRV